MLITILKTIPQIPSEKIGEVERNWCGISVHRDYDRGPNPYWIFVVGIIYVFRLNKGTMENVKDVLGRRRKKVGEATWKAEDLAGIIWQH